MFENSTVTIVILTMDKIYEVLSYPIFKIFCKS